MTDLLKVSLDRVADGVCSSCGFFDPQALEDDPELVDKIFDALNGGKPFKCHEGMPQNAFGQYTPSREQQIAAPLCAGFAAVKSELARAGATLKTDREKVALCREIIRRGKVFPCIISRESRR